MRIVQCLVLLSFLLSSTCFSEVVHYCDQPDITGPVIKADNKDETGDPAPIPWSLLGYNEGILRVAQALERNNNQITGSIDQNFEIQNHILRDLLAGLEVSKKQIDGQRTFGDTSKTYSAGFDDYSRQTGIGERVTDTLSSKLRDDLDEYMHKFKTRHEQKEFISSVNGSSNLFFLEDSLNPEEAGQVADMVKLIVMAQPPLDLNDSNQIGEDYRSSRKIMDSKMLIPVTAFGDMIANKMATAELGDWHTKIQKRMDNSDAENVDRLSQDKLMDIKAASRFANNDWINGAEGIHGKTQIGVLREYIVQEVDNLKMKFHKMVLLDKIVTLLCQKQTGKAGDDVNYLMGIAIHDAETK